MKYIYFGVFSVPALRLIEFHFLYSPKHKHKTKSQNKPIWFD